MRKIFALGLLIFYFHQVYSQDHVQLQAKILELKKRLPFLKDTARINCLASIAIRYCFSDRYTDFDSVAIYGLPALAEARKLSYKKGLFTSLFALGNNETRKSPAEGELHLKELIRISDDDSITAMAQTRLGQCLWTQAKYDEAIEVLKKCMAYYEEQKRGGKLAGSLQHIISSYMGQGKYEEAFEYAQRYLKITENKNDSFYSILSRLSMADVYMNVGDYETAKKYTKEAAAYLRPGEITKDSIVPFWPARLTLVHFGDLAFYTNQLDSALYYFKYAATGYPTAVLYKLVFAKVYLAQKKYDAAIPLFEFSRRESARIGDQNSFMPSLLGLGEAYLNKKDYSSSLKFAKQALNIAREKGSRQIIRDAYFLLFSNYEHLGKTDAALAYYKKYIQVKDSLITDQFKGKLYDFNRIAEDEKKLSEIDVLKKQKQIGEQQLKIQHQQLKQNRFLRNVLIGGITVIALLSFFGLRNISLKRKNEHLLNQQMQTELQHKATDLEMQALRAQMNPHFIFNCLTSINRFILKNETEAASDYLTKFSRLIRMVLTYSQSTVVSLKDEIEMLRLYLDMEQLRFKNAFEYSIIYHNSMDAESISVPPLILQPFCENAIWHGLMHKENYGHLAIDFRLDENILYCSVIDNGIGRAKAAEFKSKSSEKQKSLGLKITAERLALFNKDMGAHTAYEIEDMVDDQGTAAGTKVILRIRYQEPAEQLA
jgi:tetratricopeptide (TPR) repeat protein